MSRNADRGDPHGWNSLEHYLSIHDARMQRFVDEGFVVSHDPPLRSLGPQRLLMRGRIRCQHGLFIDVVKELEVEN